MLCIALILAGCSSQQEFNLAQWSREELNDRYVNPVYQSRICWEDWDRADEIEPGCLVAYYVYLKQYEGDLGEYYKALEINDNFDPIAPAGDVEEKVLDHFDITAEYLRQAESYDQVTNTYSLFGLGGLSRCDVSDAKLEGETLTLSFNSYQGERYTGEGEITIRLFDNDGYAYTSCRFTASDDEPDI